MTKQRLDEAVNYIKSIDLEAGAKIRKRVEALKEGFRDRGYAVDLNEWLQFEIGAKEKARVWKSSALSLIGQGDKDAKNHDWRTAARAYVLVEILRSYRPLGGQTKDSFLFLKRQEANACPTEQALKNLIRPKLFLFRARKYRVYTDQGSGGPGALIKAIGVGKRTNVEGKTNGGPAAMLTPMGKWLHQPMSPEPGNIDFKNRSDLQGIYTCSASGGCIPVAFLYGGKDGGPLDGVSLIHIPGGDFRDAAVNWRAMTRGRDDPSSIVVFLSSMNTIDQEADQKRYKKWLRDALNYPEDLILFHLCSSGVNHGVDRLGQFGTIPSESKYSSNSTEEKVFSDSVGGPAVIPPRLPPRTIGQPHV
jgi:hypothetical protein